MKIYASLLALISVVNMQASDDGYKVKYRLEKVSIDAKLKEAIDKGDHAVAKDIIVQKGKIPKGALHYSIVHGQDELSQFMLERGAKVNQEENGLFPLMVAAAMCKTNLVRTLLQRNACIHFLDAKNGSTALHYACLFGAKDVCDVLLEQGACPHARDIKNQMTPLHCAVMGRYGDIATMLIQDHKCDVNAQTNKGVTPLMCARAFNCSSLVLTLMQAGATIDQVDDEGNTVLHYEASISPGCNSSFDSDNEQDAVKRDDDIQTVRALLGVCPHVAKIQNKKGQTPLHKAVENDRADLITLLATHADINAVDEDGSTPLMCAMGDECRRPRLEVIDALLAANADLNAGYGWRGTPLQAACRKGNLALLRQFLAQGADANRAVPWQLTPLEGAIIRGQADFVKELIPYSDLEKLTSSEATPLWQAMYRTDNQHSQEIAIMLINAGANVHGVDKWEGSLLLPAVQNNWLDAVRLLLEKGLDPLAMNMHGISVFRLYELHPEKCSPEIMKLLLQTSFNRGPNPLNDDNLEHYAKLFSALAQKAELVMQYNKAQNAQQAKEKQEPSE